MSRDRAAGRIPNCGISIPSDARCNKATSDNPALCQLNTVSNRCEFAKIPGKNKKYTLKDAQAILSVPVQVSEPASAPGAPVSDQTHSHQQSRAFRMDNATIRVAVAEWQHNRTHASVRYGDISTWNTTEVTDMSGLFSPVFFLFFDDALGDWDTSNVTTMSGMFFSTRRFDQPLNNWDMRNVVDMSQMFASARNFNQPLDKWNTRNVTTMSGMFLSTRFDQPLNNWDTRNVVDMSQMFALANKFNQPLDKWNTSKVRSMRGMFSTATRFNQKLDTWATGNVQDMSLMFTLTKFNSNLDAWDTSNVLTMTGMFSHASAFNKPLGKWNTRNVIDMRSMFYGARAFNQPLHNWQTGKVTDMSSMFHDANGFNQSLETWELHGDLLMHNMFENAPLMLRRYPKGSLPRHGVLWGKVRAERRAVNKRLRFKWQALCDVSSGVSVDVLRRLALEAGIPSAETLSRRELCAAFSRVWSSQAADLTTALPDCTNGRGLMQYPVADTPPEFFYRYTHDGTVYCDDIRHLYEHVRNSTRNPYTNLPYSQQIIDDIRATYRRLQATTMSMADFDDDEEVVSFSSNLSRKLAELMSRLYYPNDAELFRGASEVHFSVFVQSLYDFGVISTNERTMVEDRSTLDERKALLVDLLILKIDQDPDRQPTSHGPVSRVAYEVSDVYNNLFI